MIDLPYNFQPRPYQAPILRALDNGIKRAVAVWHRRAGKEKTILNWVAGKLFDEPATAYYFFPTYTQAKKVVWEGKDKNGFPFLGHFPQDIIASRNETELKLVYKNGSIFQLIGSDNIDSVMSTNPKICVFAEYSLQDPRAWDYMRPILRENKGFAIFDYTPRGKNHGWTLYQMAKDNPEWFAEILTINDTKALTPDDINAERREGMSEELIQQEYYCSFEGIQVGSFYGRQLQTAEQEGRIGNVPYEPELPVDTFWDLGIGDSTAIWFVQAYGKEVRLIDYYEMSGEGLPHYAKTLDQKPYVYGRHYAPHDIEVRELGSGRSRKETARQLGIEFTVVPNLSIEDGIEASRSFLSRCWFDKRKCERGLNALHSYHKEWDERLHDWKPQPCHDWSSHAADAFRYLAVGHKSSPITKAPETTIERYSPDAASVAWLAT